MAWGTQRSEVFVDVKSSEEECENVVDLDQSSWKMAETVGTGGGPMSVDSFAKATSCPLALKSLSSSSFGTLVPYSSDCSTTGIAPRVACLSDSATIDAGALESHVVPFGIVRPP